MAGDTACGREGRGTRFDSPRTEGMFLGVGSEPLWDRFGMVWGVVLGWLGIGLRRGGGEGRGKGWGGGGGWGREAGWGEGGGVGRGGGTEDPELGQINNRCWAR